MVAARDPAKRAELLKLLDPGQQINAVLVREERIRDILVT